MPANQPPHHLLQRHRDRCRRFLPGVLRQQRRVEGIKVVVIPEGGGGGVECGGLALRLTRTTAKRVLEPVRRGRDALKLRLPFKVLLFFFPFFL